MPAESASCAPLADAEARQLSRRCNAATPIRRPTQRCYPSRRHAATVASRAYTGQRIDSLMFRARAAASRHLHIVSRRKPNTLKTASVHGDNAAANITDARRLISFLAVVFCEKSPTAGVRMHLQSAQQNNGSSTPVRSNLIKRRLTEKIDDTRSVDRCALDSFAAPPPVGLHTPAPRTPLTADAGICTHAAPQGKVSGESVDRILSVIRENARDRS